MNRELEQKRTLRQFDTIGLNRIGFGGSKFEWKEETMVTTTGNKAGRSLDGVVCLRDK